MFSILIWGSVSASSQAFMVVDVDLLSLKPPQATEYCNLLSLQEFKLDDHWYTFSFLLCFKEVFCSSFPEWHLALNLWIVSGLIFSFTGCQFQQYVLMKDLANFYSLFFTCIFKNLVSFHATHSFIAHIKIMLQPYVNKSLSPPSHCQCKHRQPHPGSHCL